MEEFNQRYVTFSLGGMAFEYDEEKNQKNIRKHGISFRVAARVFFDYDRIEFFDKANSITEERYDTIGNTSAGLSNLSFGRDETSGCDDADDRGDTVIGNIGSFAGSKADVLFVVYAERMRKDKDGREVDVTRLISARVATNFEKGLYYGKY